MLQAHRPLATLLTASLVAISAASAWQQAPPSGTLHHPELRDHVNPGHFQTPIPKHPDASKTEGNAMLGVMIERIGEELRFQLPMIQAGAGLVIRKVLDDSSAARGNLQKMDILLHWNDQLLVHPAQLQVLVQSAKPGDVVELECLHRGILTKTRVTLGEGPDSMPAHHSGFSSNRMLELLGNRNIPDALNKAGIDPAAIAGLLKGLDWGKTEAFPASGEKITLVGPDGKTKEIDLESMMKPDGNIGELLKQLDLGETDPLTLMSSKIRFTAPDGSTREINLAEILQSGKALGDLLQNLGRGAAPEEAGSRHDSHPTD